MYPDNDLWLEQFESLECDLKRDDLIDSLDRQAAWATVELYEEYKDWIEKERIGEIDPPDPHDGVGVWLI